MRENAELSLQLEGALGDCRRQIESMKERTLLKVVIALKISFCPVPFQGIAWNGLQSLMFFRGSYRT